MSNPNYYRRHVTKQDYDRAYNEARFWFQDTGPERGSNENVLTATRIYNIKETTLKQIVLRSKKRKRNPEGVFN
jgi:hypothetical protein